MKRFLFSVIAVATVCAVTHSVQAGVLIDDFNVGPMNLASMVTGTTDSGSASIVGGSDVFTDRYLEIEKLGPPDDDNIVGVTAHVTAGLSNLSIYSEDSGVFGRFLLEYGDGTGVDLVGTGATMFRFEADTDIDTVLTFEIEHAGNTYSSDITILGDIDTALSEYFLTFASFGAPVGAFLDVDFLRIISNDNVPSQDLRLDNLSTVTPEPGTMALLALGGLGLAGARVRRRRKASV